MSYCTWDIESTTHTSFKRKANPFDKRNHCVTHGFKHKGQTTQEVRFGNNRPPPGWLKPVLKNVRLLFGFNIKFDLLHALQDADNLAAWMEYVAGGGQIWDCQLAEYLLNGMGQKDQMLSLDEVAPRYGGNVKVDEVKALWAAGVQTTDIEPALLTRYLCGGLDENGVWQQGDVDNTEQIALAQIARARAVGQLPSILLNMGALLFTVEAERNGMYVDKPLGMTLAEALELRVAEATAGLVQYLPADMPFNFNWGSPLQRSALIFGGTVQYDCREYSLKGGGTTFVAPPETGDSLYSYTQKDLAGWLLDDGTVTLVDPFEINSHSYATFKGGKNAGEYKTKSLKVDDYTKPKSRVVKRPFVLNGYTLPERRWQGAVAGVYSTSNDVIEELATRNVPFLKVYAELMKMSKDLGTYYYRKDEDGKETGMLTLVGDDGIIHHMLNMCSTVTARLSSSNPSLQNIPKGNNSDIKTVFKSRFANGKLIQSDFSSLEVYVQAILTDCKQLISDLRAGLDMHCVKLAAKEGMTYDEVYALCKGDKYDKLWDYKRTKAKEYSFQSAFGAGDKAIATKTGMSIEDVARLRAADEARYPEIPKYYSDITAAIKGERRPARVVPHPDAPGVMCHIGVGSFRTPDGKLYSYTESPAPEYLVKRGITASFSPTEIRNYVVQGTGGEWAKAGMYLAVRAFYRDKNFGGLALLVNTVHDAVYTDADATVAFEAAALLHACMEGASDYMAWVFKWALPLAVPSDTSWGASMMDEDKIPGITERAAALRQELREQYMQGFITNYT